MNKTVLRSKTRMLQMIMCFVFIALIILFMLPIVRGICHIGMIYPSIICLILALMCAYPDTVKEIFSGKLKPLAVIASVLLGIFILGVFVTLGAMGVKASNRPKNDEKMTVIVLGCQVIGSSPSRMLSDRINSAYDYLTAAPEAVCIASGGKGDNEQISEAQCIKNRLIELGIDESRIYLEDESTNTSQNLEYSAKMIKANELSTNVAIASDNFHQLRASMFAKREGLTAYSLGCPTAWYLRAGYWAREVLGVAAAFFRGH